ncbi:MAG: hypothetical protein ACREBG_06280 [Pyrinomonadaceae bacterium]
MNLGYLASLFLLLLLLPSCRESAALRPTSVPENRPPASAQQNLENTKTVENIFTKETSLSYQGYTVTKLHKTVNVEGIKTEVSYAVLKKGEGVVANFDGLYHPAGNTTEFGVFPFLGGEPKQIVVEQAIPRNWRHWIVSLSPDVHVIFDSGDYGVDGELLPIDVNSDGVYEFSKTVTAFYGFENLPSSEAPLIDMLFKFDDKAKKYLPANHIFQDHALKGIEDEIRNVDSNDGKKDLSHVLRIVLRYVYAGKEQAGWAFYDKECELPNKDQIRSKVLAKLGNEPVYKFIYGKPQVTKQ